MQLYYYRDPSGNFGDDLNAWLWSRLVPTLFDGDSRQIFVGIGTLLNHRLPEIPVKHIFGSGAGYGDLPVINERFIVHALRGYESARLLGGYEKKVITDAAVLVRAASPPQAPVKDKEFGFIPHCQSSRNYDWSTLCDELGIHYVSAEWSVEKVFFEMTRCRTVICEAMHGAIVADALRIPWIPVICYDHISTFKWLDWLSTMGIAYRPALISSLYDIERNDPYLSRVKNSIKRGLLAIGLTSSRWTPPPYSKTSDAVRDRALQDLEATKQFEPTLSRDSVIAGHTDNYLSLLFDFSRNHKG